MKEFLRLDTGESGCIAHHTMAWRRRGWGLSEESPGTRCGLGYDGAEPGQAEIGVTREGSDGKDFVPVGV